MCDRNAKYECILIKLCTLVFECICEITTKFHEKILFDSRVINLQIPISVSNTALLNAITCLEGDSTKCGAGRICGADLNGDNLRILRLRISDKRRILLSK